MQKGSKVKCTSDVGGTLNNLKKKGNDVPALGKEYTVREMVYNPHLRITSVRLVEIINKERAVFDAEGSSNMMECSFLTNCFEEVAPMQMSENQTEEKIAS